MTSWLKQMFWEEFKENIEFFVKNFKKIIKKTWKDSVHEIKNINK